MPAGHLHRRMLSAAGSQSFVALAYSLGASAHWPLNDATNAITTSATSVSELLGGSDGSKDNLNAAEETDSYLLEQQGGLGSMGSNSVGDFYPGDNTAGTTNNGVTLRASSNSRSSTQLIWTQRNTFTYGDGGSSAYLKLTYNQGTSNAVEVTRRHNSNAGSNTTSTLSGGSAITYTNTLAPTLWAMVTDNPSGLTKRVTTYRNGVQQDQTTTALGSWGSSGFIEIFLDFTNMSGFGYDNSSVPIYHCLYQHGMSFNGVALSATDLLALYNAGI